jgi:hypothetical protein
MRTVHGLLLLALVGLVGLGGCSYPYSFPRGTLTSDDVTRFDMAGPISVDIESFNGHVVIEADPRAEGVSFQVQREGTHGFFRGGETDNAMKGIGYEAELVPGELGPVLQVRTWTDTPEPHFQRANIFITAPAVHNVKVVTHTGSVRVEGMHGSVDITTHEGDVVVMTNEAMTRPVTIVTSDGSIDYRVRGESTGRFDAETVRGEVKHRLMYGRFTMEPVGNNALRMTLNDGVNPVRLRTVDGDIRIAVVHNPVAVGTFIFEP